MQDEFCVGDFKIEPRISTISKEGVDSVVEPKVMELLAYLARNAGEVVKKEHIIRDIWAGSFVSDGVLSNAIWKLRHILGDDSRNPRFIETIPKKGYRLLAPVSFREHPHSTADRPHTTVGQETERAELQDCLASALAGRGLLVCVSGEAGIGKTTLVEDFLQHESAHGSFFVGRGRCSEHLAGTGAYLPILEAVESLTRSAGDSGLIQLLRRTAPWWYVQVFPTADDSSDLSAQTARSSPECVKREMMEFLREVADLRPLLLFFDDIHWADPSSMDIWTYICDRCSSMRILILTAYRPESLLPSDHPFVNLKLAQQVHGACREIRVRLLSCENIASYIDQTFPGHHFPAEFAQSIYQRTEGNPLFMVDLLRHLCNQGLVIRDKDEACWVLARSIEQIECGIPDSIHSLIDLKIRIFGEDNRRLLACAAIQGCDFDSAVVAIALGADAIEVEECLDALESRHGFIRRARPQQTGREMPTAQYKFVHSLYLSVICESLGPNRKASLSGAVAKALLEIHGDGTMALASQIAFLFESEGDFVRAAKHFLAAAQRGVEASADREAVMLARRGLNLVSIMPDASERNEIERRIHMLLAVILTQMRGYADEEARASYECACALCERSADVPTLCHALLGLATYSLTGSALKRALEIMQRCVGLAESSGDALMLARTYLSHSTILSHLGEQIPALEQARRSLQAYNAEDHSRMLKLLGYDLEVVGRGALARMLWMCGYPEQARLNALGALAVARKTDHPYTSAFASFLTSWVHAYMGETSSCLDFAEGAIAISKKHGFSLLEGWARALRGWAIGSIGDLEGGLKEMEQGLMLLRSAGCKITCTEFLTRKGATLAALGDSVAATAALDEAFDLMQDSGETYYEAELYHTRARILLLQPSAENCRMAESWLRRSIAVARQQGAKSFELRSANTLARCRAERGQAKDAFRKLSPIYAWFTEGFNTADLREARGFLDLHRPETEPLVAR